MGCKQINTLSHLGKLHYVLYDLFINRRDCSLVKRQLDTPLGTTPIDIYTTTPETLFQSQKDASTAWILLFIYFSRLFFVVALFFISSLSLSLLFLFWWSNFPSNYKEWNSSRFGLRVLCIKRISVCFCQIFRNLSKLCKIVKDRRPGVLQSMGLQRVRHDLATEQQQQKGIWEPCLPGKTSNLT